MSAGITEFAYVSLKKDVVADALNPETTAGHAVDYMINQVLKHPGARYAQWGFTAENPCQLRVFVDWDKVQDHLDYRETEAYNDVQKYLVPILDLDAPLSICHLSPSNTSVFLSDAATHPTVEILTMCFPSDIDSETKTAIEAQFAQFAEKTFRAPGLCKSIETSWSVESDVALPGLETEQKGAVYVSHITWKSVDDHMRNRELDAFKDNVHLLRTLPKLTKMNVVHVNAQTRLAKDAK